MTAPSALPGDLQGLPDLAGARPVAPEDHVLFRLAQLVLLLRSIAPPGQPGIGLERLGYYDFFTANPFLVVPGDDVEARTRLHLAGFDERQLSYAATGQRFANRRRRLQHDVALLLAYDLAESRAGGWGLTSLGVHTAEQLTALYADQYVISVGIVVARLTRLSDPALARAARGWLREPQLLLDLYGVSDIDDPAAVTDDAASTGGGRSDA
jgi:hypothetical protein